MTIKRKILLTITLFAIFIVLFITFFVTIDASSLLKEKQKQLMTSQLTIVNNQISHLLEINQKNTELLANLPIVINYFKGNVTTETLNYNLIEKMKFANQKKFYKDFFVLDTNGNMKGTTMKSAKSLDLSSRNYFKKAKKNLNTITSNILIAKSDQELIVITLSPIIINGKLKGFSGIAVKADYFSKFVNDLTLGINGYYIVVGSNDYIISHPKKNMITKKISNITINENDNLVLTQKMPELNYKLFAIYPNQEINHQVNRLLKNVYSIGVVSIIISILLSFFLTYELIKPINRMNKHFERVIKSSTLLKQKLAVEKKSYNSNKSLSNHLDRLEKNTTVVLSTIDSFPIEKYIKEIEQIYRNIITFIAELSHDLRTPLTLIKGYTDVLKLKISPKNNKALNQIQTSITDIETIIYNELDLVYELRDATELNKESISLEDFIDTINYELKELSKKEKRKLIIKSSVITGNANMNTTNIKRVIENIFVNALKYSNKPIELVYDNFDNYLLIHIIDQGIGMSKETLKHIKSIFYQKNKNHSGYGLGLYIADKIISKHNYELTFNSTKNKTTKVTIKINKIIID